MPKKKVIGVLALQGAVEPHRPHIEAAGADFRDVKTPEQFDQVDAFILPGGESTTMLKLIEAFGLWETLAENFRKKPVWGACAGTILMAEKVTNPAQKSFALLPMTVKRNAYGRQLESHHLKIEDYEVSFIRAPIITELDKSVEVFAREEDKPVWVRKGPYMATTFHAELTLDFPSPMHKAFIALVHNFYCRRAA